MKICFFGQKKIPSREGGVEIVVEALATRMAELGHEVTCYNRRSGKKNGGAAGRVAEDADVGCGNFKKSDISNSKNLKIKSVPTVNKKGLAAVSASFFATFAAAFGKYDIVHIHAEGPAFMCHLPKLMGKRVIVTVHGLDHKRAKWGRFASSFIMMGEEMAVKYADEIIVLSRGVQKYFSDTYGRKTVYIPNGVTKPEIREAELIREKFGLEKDGYILYLGRLVPEKGGQYLIEAYNEVDLKNGNFGVKQNYDFENVNLGVVKNENLNKSDMGCAPKKLVIAGGSGDTDAFVQELKNEAGRNENIIFTGFVQGRMLEELYSNAYCYVLPSDLEGMPLSLLEAMSYGNCCLTSDIDECAEVLEDKGVTFKKGNVKDLQEKLKWLCENEAEVAKYKAEAAEFICGKYNWDEVVEKTLLVYSEKLKS
jgi:glycosyltransferase involved in cell wall biosynthesis